MLKNSGTQEKVNIPTLDCNDFNLSIFKVTGTVKKLVFLQSLFYVFIMIVNNVNNMRKLKLKAENSNM